MDSVIGSDNEAHTNVVARVELVATVTQHGLSFHHDFCNVRDYLSFAIDRTFYGSRNV